MTSYSSFDKTIEELLKLPKYGILTGRFVNFKGLIRSFFSTVLDFLTRTLEKLFKNTPEYNLRAIAGIFLITGITILITVVIFSVIFFVRHKKRKKTLSDGILQEISDPSIRFSDYVAKSDIYLSEGKLRESLRYRYIALLLYLRDNAVINVYAAKTDKQLKNEIKANAPDIYDDFSSVIDAFNASWFGYKAITSDIQSQFFSSFELITGELITGGEVVK